MSKPKVGIGVVILDYPWAAVLSEDYNKIPVNVESIVRDVNSFLGFAIKGEFLRIGISTYDKAERTIEVAGGLEFYHDDNGSSMTIKEIRIPPSEKQGVIMSFISALLLVSGAASEMKKDQEFGNKILDSLEKVEGLNKDLVVAAIGGAVDMQHSIDLKVESLVNSDEGFEKAHLREIVKEQLEICFGVKKKELPLEAPSHIAAMQLKQPQVALEE